MSDDEKLDAAPSRKKRPRHRNDGLRKLCGHPRRNWPKCPDSWYFNFKPSGGRAYVFSLDKELGHHIATKEDAKTEADRIRSEIRAGTFVRAAERAKTATVAAVTANAVTLDAFAAIYLERVSQVRERNKSWTNDRHMFAQLGAFRLTNGGRLGEKSIAAITEDDIEAFIACLRVKGRAASTRNGYIQLLKASLRWAAKKGYVTRSLVSDDSDIIKRSKIAQRNRRLAPAVVDADGKVISVGEEHRLLAVAPPLLQRLIIAALETCCRCGELLALRWRDVNLDGRTLRIRAENAKDAEERILPVSTRLAATFEMARTDPAGHEYPGTAFVFGELGNPLMSIKKSWETTVLKAHGHMPAWKHGGLAPEARAHLRAIDLHFHDLRHEAASRLLEAGWPLHHVQEMLGHASIDQTTTYLNVKVGGLQESMRKLDDVRSRCNSVVKKAAVEPPRVHNGEPEVGDKRLIN